MNFTYLKIDNWFLTLFIAVLFLSSCEKDELPVPPHPPGNILTEQVEMGAYYPDQIWFDIETGTEVSRNHKNDWDLAFECNNPGWRITLNSASNAFIAPTGKIDINTVIDTVGLVWQWGASSGNLDSTAIGDWKTTPQIYVLDRGKNELGGHLGFTKLMIDSVNTDDFFFRFSDLTGNTWTSATVSKDSSYIFSYFSLKSGGQQVTIAPPKKDWDIVFTQYTHTFHDMNPPVSYLVTGVLLNPYLTYSAKCFDKEFSKITNNDILNYTFNNKQDNIGYDWKFYDFSQGYYVTLTKKNYIFKSHSGKMYKIHFLDWYNTKGEKGSPTFEYSEL
jgi:hypothetical protein